MADVFVSYSRRDAVFVGRLADALRERGKDVWVDSRGSETPRCSQQIAVAENTPVEGVDDIVRVFDTCPGCTNARELLSLAAPHVTSRLTVLERTVVDNG